MFTATGNTKPASKKKKKDIQTFNELLFPVYLFNGIQDSTVLKINCVAKRCSESPNSNRLSH